MCIAPLAGRTALVTDGACGTGAATTRALALLGADVVLTYRSDTAAAGELAEWARTTAGVAARALPVDPAVPDDVTTLLRAIATRGTAVDILVAGAAAEEPGTLRRLTTAFVPGMSRRGFGRVVVVGSGPRTSAAYLVSAVDELAGPGVTINSVWPADGRACRPKKVAAVVATLCRPDAELVTGARIPVPGGLDHAVPLRGLLASGPGSRA